MSLIKLLKGVGIGAGAGMGTMYLVNEEKGGTFTSYPREARYKRLLRGEQIPLPGLEDYMYSGHRDWLKDRFGYGNKQNEADRNVKIFEYTLQNAGINPESSQEDLWNIYNNAHEKVWKKFINNNIDSQSYMDFKNSIKIPKQFMLKDKLSEKDYYKLVQDDDFRRIQALDSVFDSWN